MRRILPAADAAPIPIGNTDLVFEEQRRFVRKSITLGLAIVLLAPLIIWKNEVATAIYLGVLVVIHVFALVVFVHRVPWRALFRHPAGLVTRTVGLVVFGGLLAMLRIDPQSQWFWGALTLLWLFHVGALALLHIRHRRESTLAHVFALGAAGGSATRSGGCPIGPFSADPPQEPPAGPDAPR